MKTIIEYKDGRKETHDDAAPSVDVDDLSVCMIDEDSSVVSANIDLEEVKRVVFEP